METNNSPAVENWEEIHAQFSSLYSLKLFHWTVKSTDWTFAWQQELLSSTVCHPTARRYPPPLSYSRSFLKYIISELEDNGIEVSDGIYERYAELLALKEDNDSDLFCFRTYVLDPVHSLSLQESRNLVSQGTTGLLTWQASLHLSEWIMEHKSVFSNRVVLELGSGIGFTGLVVHTMCNPKETILSDCHEQVLQGLVQNVQSNTTEFSAKFNHGGGIGSIGDGSTARPSTPCTSSTALSESLLRLVYHTNFRNLTVMKLDWETVSSVDLEELGSGVDIVIAADVVYDDSIIPALVRNLSVLLCSKRVAAAYVCSTIRNPTTRERFLSSCHERGLQHELLDEPVSKMLHYDRSTKIELVKLTKNDVTNCL